MTSLALPSISADERGLRVGCRRGVDERGLGVGCRRGVTVESVFAFISPSRASVERGVGSDFAFSSSSITTTVASTSGTSCAVPHPTTSIVRTAMETTSK